MDVEQLKKELLEELQKTQGEIKSAGSTESWLKSELKENWIKIVVFILFVLISVSIYYDIRDEVKTWLKKPTITQTSTLPININANGKESASPAPTYVNINPIIGESSSATLKPSTNNKTPSVSISDPTPVFSLNYNGKKFEYVPYTQEQYNFDPKTWEFDFKRQTEMNVNVEVPTPRYAIGMGYGSNGIAIQGDYRLGTSPFNVWGYADSKTVAAGLKFTQYSSSESKKKVDKNTTSSTLKGGVK